MAKGDATSVKSLLQHYVVVTPAIRDVLARLGPAPPLQHQVYRTADRLSPVAGSAKSLSGGTFVKKPLGSM
jgi:hypothetical protein